MIVCSWGTCWLKFGFTLTIARIVGELGELTTPKTIVIVGSRHIYIFVHGFGVHSGTRLCTYEVQCGYQKAFHKNSPIDFGDSKADSAEFQKFLTGDRCLEYDSSPGTVAVVDRHPFPKFSHEATRPGAPSRAARQKVSSAEPWKAASPNWEPNTPTPSCG